jgi:magnesium-transporting ATPase (P-type)
MQKAKDWSPNSLEKHLDSAENWTSILKQAKPDKSEAQPWRPFWRILIINLIQFSAVFSLVFVSLEIGFTGVAGLKEDLLFVLSAIAFLTLAFAMYVTNLYRRSWNRRAYQLSIDTDI